MNTISEVLNEHILKEGYLEEKTKNGIKRYWLTPKGQERLTNFKKEISVEMLYLLICDFRENIMYPFIEEFKNNREPAANLLSGKD